MLWIPAGINMNCLISCGNCTGDTLISEHRHWLWILKRLHLLQNDVCTWKSDVSTTKKSVIVNAQIARPSSPHSRENVVHYKFLKLLYLRCKMAYVSSPTYIKIGMLTTLPYYSFRSYFANTKLYLIIINRHAVRLKTFLNEGTASMRLDNTPLWCYSYICYFKCITI